jgi:hypothetical protein
MTVETKGDKMVNWKVEQKRAKKIAMIAKKKNVAIITAKQRLVLKSKWCDCGNSEFHSYPEDGECKCGMYKHHVHCKNCGGIMQVG